MGHLIRRYSTSEVFDCTLQCLDEQPICKSINFKEENQFGASKNCELNNATHSACANTLLHAQNFSYYEVIELQGIVSSVYLFT